MKEGRQGEIKGGEGMRSKGEGERREITGSGKGMGTVGWEGELRGREVKG
jgi:hypothetical protein